MRILRRQEGFTLVELMITMVVFLIAMIAASQMFAGILTQFKQQSKVSESNTEGVIGLEILRADIEQAGFGLPWDMNGVTYSEAAADAPVTNGWDAGLYNDASNPPRAIVTGAGGLNNSDVLVLKATNVATNAAANKWTYIANAGAANNIQTWGSSQEDLADTDRVSVLTPYSGAPRVLANAGGNYPKGTELTFSVAKTDASYLPVTGSWESTLVYGLATAGAMRMPFNRADYYVRQPLGANAMPARCALNTGILYKGVINHADGKHTEMPLLDCVLGMWVVVGADTGTATAPVPTTWAAGAIPATSLTAASTIRSQAKEVRVYIVAQEGQRDDTFFYSNTAPSGLCNDPKKHLCIMDNQMTAPGTYTPVLLRTVTVPVEADGYSHYRWKIYTLVSTPYNLN